jgi:hypothetical protein
MIGVMDDRIAKSLREMEERRRRLACPSDPIEAAKMALDLVAQASPGPWNVCHDGECSCKTVWSGADYPIASLECGEWGDEYPEWRVMDADDPAYQRRHHGRPWEGETLPGTKVIDAYMERYAYGHIPEHYARGDARFIVFARMALPFLAAEVLRLSAALAEPKKETQACAHEFERIEDGKDWTGAVFGFCPKCKCRFTAWPGSVHYEAIVEARERKETQE